MNFPTTYFELHADQFTYRKLLSRILIALISFILFTKLSGSKLTEQKEQPPINFLITATAAFISAFSIFTIDTFPAYIIAIFVLAIVLKIFNQIGRGNH